MEQVRVVGKYKSDEVSKENSLHCPEETRTMQEFKEESDINTIIRLFGIGENPVIPQNWITDIDISEEVEDYQTAMNILVNAKNQFMSLPAELRSRFSNDPAQFVSFVSDNTNFDEMVKLGLAIPRSQMHQANQVEPKGENEQKGPVSP